MDFLHSMFVKARRNLGGSAEVFVLFGCVVAILMFLIGVLMPGDQGYIIMLGWAMVLGMWGFTKSR